MIRFHREISQAVERLGATEVEVVSGSPHSKLFYTYGGARRRATLANSPGDANAVKVKLGDIRRDLGLSTRRKPMEDVQYEARAVQAPPDQEEPMKEVTARGTVTHRRSNRVLEFYFPTELADCLAEGEKFRAERAGQDWMILPGGNSNLHRHGTRYRIIVGDGTVARDLPYFRPREAEYLASGGQMLVRLLEPVSAQEVVELSPPPEVKEFVDEITTEPMELVPDLAAFLVARLGANPSVSDVRALLDAVRHVESTTLLRLEREGTKLLWLVRIE